MQNILFICGGQSAEHEVSISSVKNITAALDRSKYNPIIVVISRNGCWYMLKDATQLKNAFRCDDEMANSELATLMKRKNGTYLICENGERIKIAAAFPVLHGRRGEDGTIQGLFEMMELPYVGCGIIASAICMDKDFFKRLMNAVNIPVVPSVTLTDSTSFPNFSEICLKLGSDILFVKPALTGSSIGIFKARNAEDYKRAVLRAFKYCRKVLVEKFIPGRELECSVLGNDTPDTSGVGEVATEQDFYSYNAKYHDSVTTQFIMPADISEKIKTTIKDMSIRAFKAVECKGLVRADFFVSADGEVYLNELNTMPGFTPTSMYPHLWLVDGMKYTDMVSRMIDLAFEESKAKQEICFVPDEVDLELKKSVV